MQRSVSHEKLAICTVEVGKSDQVRAWIEDCLARTEVPTDQAMLRLLLRGGPPRGAT